MRLDDRVLAVSVPPVENSWFHAVVSLGPTPELAIYTDGALQMSTTASGAITSLQNTTGHLVIGRRKLDDDNQYCSVMVDEVMLWNTVLTSSEILALFKNYWKKIQEVQDL